MSNKTGDTTQGQEVLVCHIEGLEAYRFGK